jgi:G3E family GTPase
VVSHSTRHLHYTKSPIADLHYITLHHYIFALDAVIAVVDALRLPDHLAASQPHSPQVIHQIAYADVVLLNKTDLVDADVLPSLR